MAFQLPELPYSKDSLAPHISAETLEYHYGKHHNAYVTKLNELVGDGPLSSKSLEDLIKTQEGAIFNNAAQVWNHSFYWNCLSPQGGGAPQGAIAEAINKTFGNFDTFKTEFTNAALTQFGSGWAWLVKNKDNELSLVKTSNAGTPLTDGFTPLLTCDVWEHAYYVDYRNARPKYVEAFWNLVNWDFVNSQFA